MNQAVVNTVNEGKSPYFEPGLAELIAKVHANLKATTDYGEAIKNSSVSFIVVPTPSEPDGSFSTIYVESVVKELAKELKKKSDFHVITLNSTVLPGATERVIKQALEKETGKKCGKDFGVCYSPEFIALGSVIHDFLNPDFLLVGEFDARSGERLEQVYTGIMENGAPCQRMSIENAELAKIALNTYVTTKITFANMLADLCERLPGGDVDVVTNAIGLDTRIGRKYLKGALGYGGPCFPRDNVALNYMALQLDTRAHIAETTDWCNRSLPDWLMTRLDHALRASSTVGVLGLTYKPYSHVTEESHGILLAKALIQAGKRVIAFDPLVSEIAREELPPGVTVYASLRECLAEADTVLITTPDPIFKNLTANNFNLDRVAVTVVDFWRILDRSIIQHPKIKYVAVGRSVDDAANAARLAQLWTGDAEE